MRIEPRLDSAALQPRLPDRVSTALLLFRPSGRRTRALRRLVAVALLVVAGVLASLTPSSATDGTAVLAVARDLPAGAALVADDVDVVTVPSPPDGVLLPVRRADLGGALLSGAVRRGEILTDARIVGDRGPDPGPGRAAVPVPLAEPTIAALLTPGMHVVLAQIPDRDGWVGDPSVPAGPTAGTAAPGPVESVSTGRLPNTGVLAADAVVLSIAAPVGGIAGSQRRVIIVGVPGDAADAVTAAAAAGMVTIRFADK